MVRVQSNANATGLTALVEFLNKSHAAKKTMEIIELKQVRRNQFQNITNLRVLLRFVISLPGI